MRANEIKDYLSEKLGSSVDYFGDPTLELSKLAKIEEAGYGEISFISNPKYEKFLTTTEASALIVSKDLKIESARPGLGLFQVDDAYLAFVFLLEKFTPPIELIRNGISPSSFIHPSAILADGVSVGENAFIGENVRIGRNTRIFQNSVILAGSLLGEDCTIYPNVTIYHGSKIGHRVTIHSGAVIGADGFGFAPRSDGRYHKIPQIGIVRIGNDVEIGANTTIDRATITETVIEDGVKIDNLVQIGHNCKIGKNTVIAGQVGISGSTKIGENCLLGGQVGLVGHIEIGNKITIGSKAGVAKSFLNEGESLRGIPARPIRHQLRQEALLGKLADLIETVKVMQKELDELKSKST
ncbi:MAG: UDP-3-O-(3-hydroxymyristoyl)glucosamine N-acyltransferase [Chloroherpetonaceae bacterium]|nr:UDP-3-O-(3-hydroxymyristoyl)glucosamine N-acyltransferase [Chloroherpetonaceae bacterium]